MAPSLLSDQIESENRLATGKSGFRFTRHDFETGQVSEGMQNRHDEEAGQEKTKRQKQAIPVVDTADKDRQQHQTKIDPVARG
jgi:hypothetical protein